MLLGSENGPRRVLMSWARTAKWYTWPGINWRRGDGGGLLKRNIHQCRSKINSIILIAIENINNWVGTVFFIGTSFNIGEILSKLIEYQWIKLRRSPELAYTPWASPEPWHFPLSSTGSNSEFGCLPARHKKKLKVNRCVKDVSC